MIEDTTFQCIPREREMRISPGRVDLTTTVTSKIPFEDPRSQHQINGPENTISIDTQLVEEDHDPKYVVRITARRKQYSHSV